MSRESRFEEFLEMVDLDTLSKSFLVDIAMGSITLDLSERCKLRRTESGEIVLHECPSAGRKTPLKRYREEPKNRPSTSFAKGSRVENERFALNTSISIGETNHGRIMK